MTLPLGEVFFLTEVFFPVHADSSFVGASDIGQWFILGSRCNLNRFQVEPKSAGGLFITSTRSALLEDTKILQG